MIFAERGVVMTAVANEWFRWFSLEAWDIVEGEHVFFRYTSSRRHGVTAVVDGQLCFVSVDGGVVQEYPLDALKGEGGVLCRTAYGVTDWLPRMYGVGNFVLRDNTANISRRTLKALHKPVATDAATWAVSICISVEQGAHIMAGGQHGVVFQIDDEYRLFTVVEGRVVRCALWEFLSKHKVTTLSYVANTALSPSDQHKAITGSEHAIRIGMTWPGDSSSFCEALRRGSSMIAPQL